MRQIKNSISSKLAANLKGKISSYHVEFINKNLDKLLNSKKYFLLRDALIIWFLNGKNIIF